MKGITFFKENREPTLDNPNEIICGIVDDNAEIYIKRLEDTIDNSKEYIKRILKWVRLQKDWETEKILLNLLILLGGKE